jgi:hypothetical protein
MGVLVCFNSAHSIYVVVPGAAALKAALFDELLCNSYLIKA